MLLIVVRLMVLLLVVGSLLAVMTGHLVLLLLHLGSCGVGSFIIGNMIVGL